MTVNRAFLLNLMIFLVLSAPATLHAQSSGKSLKKLYQHLDIVKMGNAPAPDFALLSAEGDSLSLAGYRGRILVLHFWASWCLPCRKEIPELNRLNSRIGDLPVSILGVSIDKKGDSSAVAGAVNTLQIPFPVAMAVSGNIPDQYWSRGIPVSYLITADGRLAGRILGAGDWSSLEMLEVLSILSAGGHRSE